ncbi:hypothetical protein Hanom_Chr04g00322421 [Helianthus anomalus]
MRDKRVTDAFQHTPDSKMDEGPSRPISGYETDAKGSFTFKAKSFEPIPPKKKRKTTIATLTLSEGTTQIPVTKRLWEELDRRLANCDMFQPIVEETNPNLHVYSEPIQMISQPIPASNSGDTSRIPAPTQNPMEQWQADNMEFLNHIRDSYFQPPPQFPPYIPNVLPPMNPDNVAKLRHYGEELID